ncbi:MAG: ABC transporter permease, partial [bacterium]
MREVIALAIKDLKLIVRDKTGFFFVLFFPLLMAVFFGSIFGGNGGGQSSAIPVLVVDEDMSEESAAFVKRLADATELDIRPATREEAISQVRRGKVSAYIALTPGFGEASKRMFWGEAPNVELGVDPSKQTTAGMLEGILMKYGSERFQKLFTDPASQRSSINDARKALRGSVGMPSGARDNLNQFFTDLDRFLGDGSFMAGTDTAASGGAAGGPPGGFQPLVVTRAEITVSRAGPTSAYAVSFPQGAIWGIIGAAAAFGISIVVERTHGTLVRLQTAPISRSQILAGKALACFATTVVISVALFLLARLVFGLRPGSVPLLALAIVSSSIAFVGIMMLLSVIGKTEQSAGGIGWGILLV